MSVKKLRKANKYMFSKKIFRLKICHLGLHGHKICFWVYEISFSDSLFTTYSYSQPEIGSIWTCINFPHTVSNHFKHLFEKTAFYRLLPVKIFLPVIYRLTVGQVKDLNSHPQLQCLQRRDGVWQHSAPRQQGPWMMCTVNR